MVDLAKNEYKSRCVVVGGKGGVTRVISIMHSICSKEIVLVSYDGGGQNAFSIHLLLIEAWKSILCLMLSMGHIE